MKKIILAIIIAITLVACGDKSKEYSKLVKTEYSKQLNQIMTENDMDYNIEVSNVILEKIDSKNYDGFATVVFEGKDYLVPVSIREIGDQVAWQAEGSPQLMAAITQKVMKDAFSELNF